MTASSRAPGVRRLAATLYAYAFFDEFVLLYPVYVLLFADTGLSEWQISSLFVIWSATGILLEVPSGALADALSRRLLLCVGPLLTAAGFAVWILAPAYWAFALGFVLWGAKGALGSGAFEALVYEELDRLGAADRYARLLGRARAAGVVAVMLAIAVAAPVFAAGGYPLVGLASVVACLLTAAIATLFPEHRAPGSAADDGAGLGYRATLRAGLTEARTDPAVRRALLLVAPVAAVWGALEEYTPLLARETGVGASTVPLLLLLIWGGVTAGGLLAGTGSRLTTSRLAALLALAALALALGAASGRPAGIALVALAFGAFQVATVVADARLQERITGSSRATVTSLASLATEAATIAVYAGYAAAASNGHGVAFALFAVPYLVVAVWLGVSGRRAAGRSHPAGCDRPLPHVGAAP